jgi:hypothetical protein
MSVSTISPITSDHMNLLVAYALNRITHPEATADNVADGGANEAFQSILMEIEPEHHCGVRNYHDSRSVCGSRNL